MALCAADGTELLTQTNPVFSDPNMPQSMQRWFMNASAYIGEQVCIKIVDKATSDFAFIYVDSVKASLTYEEAKAILDADKAWAAEYRTDVLESEEPMGVATKGIIQAQHDYYENLTLTDPRVLSITKPIPNQTGKVNTAIDLTAHAALLEWNKIGATANDVTVTITGAKKDGQAVEEFNATAFTATQTGTYTVSYTVTDGTTRIERTYDLVISNNNMIVNGDFETGDLTGWTIVEGNAFADVNVFNGTQYFNEGRDYHKQGTYHLDGWQGANEGGTGIIRSTTFVLDGTGKISFRLGGHNGTGAYISVKKADGTEVARFTNTKQRAATGADDPIAEAYMYIYVFDLASVAEIGDELYVEIVDNAVKDWGLLFVDDIQTYHTEDTLAALGTKDTDWFDAVNQYVAPTPEEPQE